MKSRSLPCIERARSKKQRGLALFFALIALVVMSLAAVALIRSVDTSNMIAGNLAFKQAATNSGDSGVEAAIVWLRAQGNSDPMTDGTHPLNSSNSANGYYSYFDSGLDLFNDANWAISTIPEIVDSSNNHIRYIIQRLCRISTNNIPAKDADCLFGSAAKDVDEKQVVPQGGCLPGQCTSKNSPPQIRITVRVTGPRNTVSYLQAFVF